MADEYIDKVEVGAKIQMMYIRREMDYGGENDFCRGMRKALRVIENMPAADVQSLSVVAEHIKNRLYETAFNTTEEKARDAIADMAERIDFWIDELKDGDNNA